MAEHLWPAPCEGAGASGLTELLDVADNRPSWAREEISNRPFAISHAADLALEYAEIVHDMDCECRGRLFPGPIIDRCANPLLLMNFLPFDAIATVRREAERMLRAWPR